MTVPKTQDCDVQGLQVLLNIYVKQCGAKTTRSGEPCQRVIGKSRWERVSSVCSAIALSKCTQVHLIRLHAEVACHAHQADRHLEARLHIWINAIKASMSLLYASNDSEPGDFPFHVPSTLRITPGEESKMIGDQTDRQAVKLEEDIETEPKVRIARRSKEYSTAEPNDNPPHIDRPLDAHELEGDIATERKDCVVRRVNGYFKAEPRSDIPSISEALDAHQVEDKITIERQNFGVRKVEEQFMAGPKGSNLDTHQVDTQAPIKQFKPYPTEKFESTPFTDIEKYDALISATTVWQSIVAYARKPLSPRDLQTGRIYIFTVPGNSGFVKIGITRQPIEKRMSQWKSYCRREPILLYPPEPSSAASIPHAYRVEALIHAELGEHRRKIRCSSCRRQHQEWFEVSYSEAVSAVQKWTKWIETGPYNAHRLKSGDKWHLQEDWRKKFKKAKGGSDMAALILES